MLDEIRLDKIRNIVRRVKASDPQFRSIHFLS